ncbi:hypothetical protein [Fulvivirga imtechensis]|uniref:hypothetical protein n=1 Tax=Fulvivirga imtechensis TaxID=881893 RepID=UPI001607C035|nr:hypothetical protein [Fulvivirga imtechensis]
MKANDFMPSLTTEEAEEEQRLSTTTSSWNFRSIAEKIFRIPLISGRGRNSVTGSSEEIPDLHCVTSGMTIVRGCNNLFIIHV